MSTITVVVFTSITFIALLYMGMKQFCLNNLKRALNNQDYTTVVKVADMKVSRRLLNNFHCDLYKIRAYYLAKDVENFDIMLDQMIRNHDYKEDDKKEFLTTYYHTFLLKENQKYADILLQGIKDMKDRSYTLYNEQAYEVVFHKRTDLIDVMDKEIDSKQYYGFPLGVIVYYMGIQYLMLNDKEHALIFFKNAVICFHPKSIYVPHANEYIRKLTEEVEEQKADIDEEIKTYD